MADTFSNNFIYDVVVSSIYNVHAATFVASVFSPRTKWDWLLTNLI